MGIHYNRLPTNGLDAKALKHLNLQSISPEFVCCVGLWESVWGIGVQSPEPATEHFLPCTGKAVFRGLNHIVQTVRVQCDVL